MEAEGEGVSAPDKERYLGLDCEMVGVGADGKRSALARVTLVDFDGRVVYDEHVRPVERVTDFRTWVSGVKAKHLKEAISLKEVRGWVGGTICGLVGGGGGARFGVESQLKAAAYLLTYLLTMIIFFLHIHKHDQKQCIQQVGELVRGKILVGHALQNDFQVRFLSSVRRVGA